MAHLLSGTGLRLLECLRLRVKDIGFGYRQIAAREGEGMPSSNKRAANRESVSAASAK